MFLLQRSWTEMELLPLVCFCLLTCSGTTFGDEGPLVTTRMVKLNGEVILPCSFSTIDITAETFDWRKEDMKEVFMYAAGSHYNNGRPGQDPYFKGRVFHFDDQLQSGNASIVIRNIKKTDSGRYSCIFPFPQPGRTRSIIELIVDCILKDRTKENKGASPEPSVTNLDQTDDRALLQCKVQGAFPKPKVQWLDSDNNTVPAEETQVTESEGKFNIILKTTVTKTGYYRCVSTQEEICHQIYHEIHVFWSGSYTGWIVAAVVSVVAVVLAVVVFVLCKKQNSNTSNY
ncbi:V-set and immunoglobulin domain-containing protein 1-like isoform X7 [Mugil cephalus]|uniref:V-set and immunoglobulin domain-containing protein 1-like isoform X7 n=1 Tax=Mugil cephalus TaxID=48193 RepID=UPI001FB659BE|nr:V-set and immunoglobulin domain-containing protein 1-like isoform X7 [Mugil cephalus]